jgi:serine/threonine protein kinase
MDVADWNLEFVGPVSTGGNATTMVVHQGRRRGVKRLARITWTYNLEVDMKMHTTLYRNMPNWTVAIRDFHNFHTADPPENIKEMIRQTKEGAEMLAEMENDPERECAIIIMDYAELGDFVHLKNPTKETICFIISEVLLFLYCAQVKLGFQHGDLHGGNVVLTMEAGVMQPKIIDYDFASFYTQKKFRADDHYLFTLFLMPPELLDTEHYPFDARVLGAVDIWSLGLMLISRIFNVLSIILEIRKKNDKQGYSESKNTHRAIYLLQSTLDIKPYYKRQRTISKNVTAMLNEIRQRIVVEQPEVHEICKLMLHSNPKERTLHGQLYRYFDMQYFRNRRDMMTQLRKIARLRLGVKKDEPLPSTTDYSLQVTNLVESNILLSCVNCNVSLADMHVCRNTGHVVCGMQCWNEING